jgi:type I restriction enzyme M protein
VRTPGTSAKLRFEAQLWAAANALRGSMDAAEYKHVVLGLIFLKYISDAFEEHRKKLLAEPYADPEDPDEYRAENIFWVPPEARWSELQKNARQPTIGELVDRAMEAVERDNPSLKGVLPKDYARPALDKTRLGQLIDLISNIPLGGADNHARDILGRVYEYFLGQFASAEGKKGGEFYTPRCVVKLLVEMLRPYRGRVYDPCCGSGGMFVQSEAFIEAHGGRSGDISIYGQESVYTTWRLCKMNLAIRGIDGRIEQGDSFLNDRFPDLKADYILANPPFNMKNWGGEQLREDKRWKFGIPPVNNANFAWVQHIIHHLAPTGLAGFVLANGSMSSNQAAARRLRSGVRIRPANQAAELLEAIHRSALPRWTACHLQGEILPCCQPRDLYLRSPYESRAAGLGRWLGKARMQSLEVASGGVPCARRAARFSGAAGRYPGWSSPMAARTGRAGRNATDV